MRKMKRMSICTTQRAIICFVAKSERVMAHEEGGKKLLVILIVEIFW
jgi:hypothetical protein